MTPKRCRLPGSDWRHSPVPSPLKIDTELHNDQANHDLAHEQGRSADLPRPGAVGGLCHREGRQDDPRRLGADVFDCECCGKTTAVVAPICEAVAGPTFEFSRNDQKVQLTITWLDGEDYDVEVASVPEALSVMRFEISMAPKASMALNG
jgi:hypothetical protein